MKPRQVPIFLYWRVENVQFWINSIGHLGWLSCILNFPRFHKNVNSLELWKEISENSSPKGSFWRNKRKSEFSSLSADSRYLLAVALKSSKKLLRMNAANIPSLAQMQKTLTWFSIHVSLFCFRSRDLQATESFWRGISWERRRHHLLVGTNDQQRIATNEYAVL